MSDAQEAIRSTALFSELSKKDVKQLAGAMSETSFPAGTRVVEKGQQGLGFFVITSGTATVSVDGERLGVLKAGDHFGEIALIDEGARMAEVTADTDLRCLALAGWQFRPFVRDHPDVAWALLRSLVKRLVRDRTSTGHV
jgi:CRP/FNR family transcriptional regulator, cyclic AMP receptor protein